MYKARGELAFLNDGTMREITVRPSGITGDEILVNEITFLAGRYQKEKRPLGPAHYMPLNNYLKDELAVLFILKEVCRNIQLSGDVPSLKVEEGKIH